MVKACNDFVKELPNSEHILEVLMKYAETLYGLKEWDLAAKVYKKTISAEFRDSPYYGQSINMIAQCYLKMGNYQQSEQWFNNLADAFPDSAQYVKRAKKMLASAKFKIAENLMKQGKPNKAAANFLKLAFSTNDEEIAKASIFQAASQFEQAGELDKAVKAYERMLEERPNISFKDELLMKMALLYEKQENWLRASEKYLILVDQCPSSKLNAPALLKTAHCYGQMKLWYKCRQIYQRYCNRFSYLDADDYIEALYKIGEISYNNKDDRSALEEFTTTVRKFKQLKQSGKSVQEYYPAKAQFMIGEINFKKYARVKIVPPLNISMKKKTQLLQTVLKEYIEAGKYQVADWTTASSYKIGKTFENLAEAIETAPIPAEYTEEEKQTYLQAINKQVISAKEKALNIYNGNITNAEKNNIHNEWIDNSKERIKQLILELSEQTNLKKINQPNIVPANQIKGK